MICSGIKFYHSCESVVIRVDPLVQEKKEEVKKGEEKKEEVKKEEKEEVKEVNESNEVHLCGLHSQKNLSECTVFIYISYRLQFSYYLSDYIIDYICYRLCIIIT